MVTGIGIGIGIGIAVVSHIFIAKWLLVPNSCMLARRDDVYRQGRETFLQKAPSR